MTKRADLFLLLLLLVLSGIQAYAQRNVVRPLLENLLNDPRPITEIASYNYILDQVYDIPDGELPYMRGIHQTLVRNQKGLYMLVDGTGRVYKVEKKGHDIHFERMDSTKFFGYNFGFSAFSYQDSIYSFGGYGFWRFNGLLRVFIEQTGDWSPTKLNRELAFGKPAVSLVPLFYLDQPSQKVFIGYSLKNIEGLEHPTPNIIRTDTAYVLDLDRKRWSSLGPLNPSLLEKASNGNNLGASPWGQLIHSNLDDKFYLVNYHSNDLSFLGAEKSTQISRFVSPTCILFFRDSTLWVSDLQTGRMNAIDLESADFISSGTQVYTPQRSKPSAQTADQNQTGVLPFVSGSIILLLTAFIIWRERVHRKIAKAVKAEPASSTPGSAHDLFDDLERAVIQAVYSNSCKASTTSIDELNQILGVANKSNEVQKKHRSDTIISINKKARYLTNSNDLLIWKKRLDKDKRSFEYFIPSEKLDDWAFLKKLK